jgi:hypothetical protein
MPQKPVAPPSPPPMRSPAPHVQGALRAVQAKLPERMPVPHRPPEPQRAAAPHVVLAVQAKVAPQGIVQPAFRRAISSAFRRSAPAAARLSASTSAPPASTPAPAASVSTPAPAPAASVSTPAATASVRASASAPRRRASAAATPSSTPATPTSRVDTSYGPMPGSRGREWKSPRPQLKKLKPGLFGYFSPKLNRIVINSHYSEYVQKITVEHETAHAAHATYLGIDTAEDLITTEFVAWWRDALYAVRLAISGQGPAASDVDGQQILQDAVNYLANPHASFIRVMASYHDQIGEFLQRDGNPADPAAFVNRIVSSIQISGASYDLQAWRAWEARNGSPQ